MICNKADLQEYEKNFSADIKEKIIFTFPWSLIFSDFQMLPFEVMSSRQALLSLEEESLGKTFRFIPVYLLSEQLVNFYNEQSILLEH